MVGQRVKEGPTRAEAPDQGRSEQEQDRDHDEAEDPGHQRHAQRQPALQEVARARHHQDEPERDHAGAVERQERIEPVGRGQQPGLHQAHQQPGQAEHEQQGDTNDHPEQRHQVEVFQAIRGDCAGHGHPPQS